MPEQVAREIRVRGDADPAARALAANDWLEVVPSPEPAASVQAWDLGPGETSVLTWAIAHPGAVAILDDLAARRCAAAHHVGVRGTLGLVLVAKRRGLIPGARPLLEKLRQSGMYLSDSVLDDALSLVDE